MSRGGDWSLLHQSSTGKGGRQPGHQNHCWVRKKKPPPFFFWLIYRLQVMWLCSEYIPPGFLEVLLLHAVAPKGQVKLPSSLQFMPSIGDPGWSSSLRPCPPLLMRPCSCLGAKDTRHLFLNHLHIKIFNALQYFPPSLSKKHEGRRPTLLASGNELHNKGKHQSQPHTAS